MCSKDVRRFAIATIIAMVLVVHRKSEEDQFMVECSCNTPNEELIATIAALSNARTQLAKLADQLESMIEKNSQTKEERVEEVTEDVEGYSQLRLNEHQKVTLDKAVNSLRLFLSKVCEIVLW